MKKIDYTCDFCDASLETHDGRRHRDFVGFVHDVVGPPFCFAIEDLERASNHICKPCLVAIASLNERAVQPLLHLADARYAGATGVVGGLTGGKEKA